MTDCSQDITELAELADIFDAWGENAKECLPLRSKIVLVFYMLAKRALFKTRHARDVHDEFAYRRLKYLRKNGQMAGDDETRHILTNTLREGAENIKAISWSVSLNEMRRYLPKMDNPGRIRELATKYKCGALLQLMPDS